MKNLFFCLTKTASHATIAVVANNTPPSPEATAGLALSQTWKGSNLVGSGVEETWALLKFCDGRYIYVDKTEISGSLNT